MGHLAATELERELDLIAISQEVLGVLDLDVQIVLANFDGLELNLLELSATDAGARFVGLLLLLIAPLAVVHDLTDRGAGSRGDFDEIQTGLAGTAQRLIGGRGAEFVVFLIDQEDRGDADLLVVAEIGGNGRDSCAW